MHFIIILAAVVIILMLKLRKITVFEFEKALKFSNGKFIGMLDCGAYWHLGFSTSFVKVDMRQRLITVKGQEVLTKDAVSLKTSLAVQFGVENAEKVILNLATSIEESIYTVVQLALRKAVSEYTVEEFLEKRDELSQKLTEIASKEATEIGIKLITAQVKDIMLTGELKKAFSQVAQAKQEGLALLEKARGETAALRNLANSAGMLKDNPALMQLRMLHSTGNTLVMGLNPVHQKEKEE